MLTNLTKAQITLHNDKYDGNPITSFALELEKVVGSDGPVLYVTKPFQPPRRAFKIEVRYNIALSVEAIILNNTVNLF